METLPAELPEETRELYSRLLKQPFQGREAMKQTVQKQIDRLKSSVKDEEVADLTLAEEVHAGRRVVHV